MRWFPCRTPKSNPPCCLSARRCGFKGACSTAQWLFPAAEFWAWFPRRALCVCVIALLLRSQVSSSCCCRRSCLPLRYNAELDDCSWWPSAAFAGLPPSSFSKVLGVVFKASPALRVCVLFRSQVSSSCCCRRSCFPQRPILDCALTPKCTVLCGQLLGVALRI